MRKRKGACGKWGLYSCSSLLSFSCEPFFFFFSFFFARRVSLSHISERGEEKKNAVGGVRDVREQWGTEKKTESESDSFLKGLSGRVESEKRKGQEERGRMRRCQICLSL